MSNAMDICIMIEEITEFYIGSISDENTWFLPKEEISMPFRNITISIKLMYIYFYLKVC
jgi:hypothetical protein